MSSHEITLWVSPDPSDYEVTRIPSIIHEGERFVKVDRGDGVVMLFTTADEVGAWIDVMERVTNAWFKDV